MSDEQTKKIMEFLDNLTDEDRQNLYIVLCYVCEIINSQRKDKDNERTTNL